MKKRLTITITPAYSLDENIKHDASRVVVSTDRTFTDDTKKQVITVDNKKDSTVDILTVPIILDFPYFNSKYFVYTETRLGNKDNNDDDVWSGPSPISMITQNGLNSAFHYSNTIIKTPVVEVTDGRTKHTSFIIETEDMVIYRGKGKHTHTSYQLICNGTVVWERIKTPDHLTKIQIPYEFLTGVTYSFRVAHHSGDVQSGWGTRVITIGKNSENIIKIKGLTPHKTGYKLYKDVMNFFRVVTNRIDIISVDWALIDNGKSVISASDLPQVTNENISMYDLHIPGIYLSNLSNVKLVVRLVTAHEPIDRIIDIKIEDKKPVEGVTVDPSIGLNYSGKGTSLLPYVAYEADDTWIMGSDDKVGLVKTDGTNILKFDNGESIQLEDLADKYELLSRRYKDMILLSYVKEIKGDNIKYERHLMVLRYNSLNNQIYNLMSKNYILGEVQSPSQSFELPLLSDGRFAYVINNNSKIELSVVDLSSTTTKLLYRYDININEKTITPKLAKYQNYLLIIGSSAINIYHEGTNSLSPINKIDDRDVDFIGWLESVERSNAIPTIIGINKRTAGDEIGVVYEFDPYGVKYVLKTTFDLPIVNGSKNMNRPSVMVSKDSSIGLVYPTKTIWLS